MPSVVKVLRHLEVHLRVDIHRLELVEREERRARAEQVRALARVVEPEWTPGPLLYRVSYPGGVRVRLNPHGKSAVTRADDIVQPCEVVLVWVSTYVSIYRQTCSGL